MEEVVGVAAPEADEAEDDVEGDGGRQPAHERPEPARGDQVARHVNAAVALNRSRAGARKFVLACTVRN